MSVVTESQVHEVLATVNDPEIKRPITELGMVDEVKVDGSAVLVRILLTVSGCPMKDTLTRDSTAAVKTLGADLEVTVDLGVMSDEQRKGLKDLLRGGQAEREIPFAQPGSLTK